MSEPIKAEDLVRLEISGEEEELFKEAGDKVVKALDWMSNSGVESVEKDAELITSFIKEYSWFTWLTFDAGGGPRAYTFSAGVVRKTKRDGPNWSGR